MNKQASPAETPSAFVLLRILLFVLFLFFAGLVSVRGGDFEFGGRRPAQVTAAARTRTASSSNPNSGSGGGGGESLVWIAYGFFFLFFFVFFFIVVVVVVIVVVVVVVTATTVFALNVVCLGLRCRLMLIARDSRVASVANADRLEERLGWQWHLVGGAVGAKNATASPAVVTPAAHPERRPALRRVKSVFRQ